MAIAPRQTNTVCPPDASFLPFLLGPIQAHIEHSFVPLKTHMAIPRFFRPVPELNDEERQRGLGNMTRQAISASGADGLASGGFLASFALILGASNFHIGIMTAIPFVMQPLQLIAVLAIERLRLRKAVAVTAYFFAYATWIPIALLPFLVEVPNPTAVALMLVFIALRGVSNAFVNASWNGWLRDLVPQALMGKFFAQRLRVATISSAVLGLIAALYIDWWKTSGPSGEIFAYSYAMLFGSVVLGFSAVGFMARMPEPQMIVPAGEHPSVFSSLGAPFRDRNFRQLIKFLFLWNFVAQLAVPFFTVYMLTKLGMNLTWVVGLGVLSQLANVLFLRVWGPFVDQFGSKVVLSLSSSLYFLVILGWTFTAMPEKHAFTVPLLVALHMLMGIASAGINIATTTIRMKMAPQAQAMTYLTATSLAASLGAGVSPLLGGAFADFFSVRHLEIAVQWVDPVRTIGFPAVFLTGFDFLFVIAFVLGLFTLGVLAGIREKGEAKSAVVMDELVSQTRQNLRVLTSVPGLSFVANFPVESLRRLPPIPGLDVAVGVTAHQLSSTIKAAIEGANYGQLRAGQLTEHVRQSVERAADAVEQIGKQGAEVATGATEGAMWAAADIAMEVGHVAEEAMRGTMQALAKTATDPLDALRGATHGVIQGASEAGLHVGNAVRHAVKAAREAATELGVSEQQAGKAAAQAAVESAAQLGKAMEREVVDAVLQELMDDTDTRSAEETASDDHSKSDPDR